MEIDAKTQRGARRLQRDPVAHITQLQGVENLESYQQRICRAVARHDRVSVAACHDVGKTFTMAKIVLWIGSSFPGSKIITTAPTFIQVEKLLWSEINSGHKNAPYPLGGKMLTTQWKIDDDWFAIGMSPKDDAGSGEGQGTGSRFQGFHTNTGYLVIVFDEATGVHPKRWIQAEGMLTSANVKFIAIGNPTSRNSEFFKCFKSGEWHKIYINCFDSPNLKANDVTNETRLKKEVSYYLSLSDKEKQARLKSYKVVHPALLTLGWCVSKIAKWGWDHPLTRSKILGKFPQDDENALFRLGDIENAQALELHPDPNQRAVGVDPARFGTDDSVITILEGCKQTEHVSVSGQDTMQVAGRVIAMLRALPRKKIETVVVDSTGIGAGVVDALRHWKNERGDAETALKRNIRIVEYHGGNAPGDEDRDKEQYLNLRARSHVELSQDLKAGRIDLIEESVYTEEMPNILYDFDRRGRYRIESKEHYKSRTNMGSPDSTDSLVLANHGRRMRTPAPKASARNRKRHEDAPTIVGSGFDENW